MHRNITPAIQYWGTPVILISTLNDDGSVNVAPMSSAWWLGWSCMLGMDASTQTVQNLKRDGQCVLNLASLDNADAVNRLARTTGARDVPMHKKLLGFRYEAQKLAHAHLTAMPSISVRPPRIQECQVQLEAVVEKIRPFAVNDSKMALPMCSIEVRILQVHADEAILRADDADKIDPLQWKPLLMSFRELFALGPRAVESRLGRGDENAWAPWKGGLARRASAQVLGLGARAKYGISEEDDEAPQ